LLPLSSLRDRLGRRMVWYTKENKSTKNKNVIKIKINTMRKGKKIEHGVL